MFLFPLVLSLTLLGNAAPSIASDRHQPYCNLESGNSIQSLSGAMRVCFPRLGTWRLSLGEGRYLLVNQNQTANLEGQITVIHGDSLAPVVLNSDREIVEGYLRSLTPELKDWQETSRRWSNGQLTVVLHHRSEQRIRIISIAVKVKDGEVVLASLDRFYLTQKIGSMEASSLEKMFLIKAP